jgi:hypothetical protein
MKAFAKDQIPSSKFLSHQSYVMGFVSIIKSFFIQVPNIVIILFSKLPYQITLYCIALIIIQRQSAEDHKNC